MYTEVFDNYNDRETVIDNTLKIAKYYLDDSKKTILSETLCDFFPCNPSTDENWYQSVIEYEINPLIEEYWFDNEEKAQEYMDYLLG